MLELRRLVVLASLLLGSFPLFAQKVDTPLPLWPDGPPKIAGVAAIPTPENVTPGERPGKTPIQLMTNVSQPMMTVYHPSAALDQHAAVLVFPGGGYSILAYDLEGTEVCDWLNSLGITAVLVKYRVPNPAGIERGVIQLQDAQRAIGLVRSHATDWHIAPDKVGVIGFSAGGNLAALASTHFAKRNYTAIDAADSTSARPDFAMLIYPAYIDANGSDDQVAVNITVTPDTPRTFLVQAENDDQYINASLTYYIALKKAKVPVELHLYADGGHGFGLEPSPLPVSHWPELAATWMRTIGVLSR